MALIKCPECGKEISDRAPACIYCGYPLEKKQQEISAEPKAQPRHTPKATENDISLGFTLFSIDEKKLNLECKNCSKVYKFSREIHFSEVSEKGCLTRTTIRCPNCGNVAYDGTNIFLKQLEKSGSVSQQRATDRSQDDTSGSGCLVCLIIVGILVAGGMFLLTDGFSDFALWWLVFPLTFAALILVGMIYGLASSDPKEVKENWDREKYSDYKFTCPMCGSKKVKRIGTVNRAASVAAVGLASSKIGKQYECDDCKHKW